MFITVQYVYTIHFGSENITEWINKLCLEQMQSNKQETQRLTWNPTALELQHVL